MLTKAQKEELAILSEYVYGSKSRAEKILRNGMPKATTVKKQVKSTKEDGTVDMVEQEELYLDKSGRPVFVMTYPSYDELLVEMNKQKDKIDIFKEQLRKLQEDSKKEVKKEQNETV